MAKTKRKKLIADLDEICKLIVRIRDENRCQYCGKYVTGSEAHTSHVIPKARGYFLRWDLLNLKVLCTQHHIPWWHRVPTESGKWFAERFPARYEYLEERKHKQAKFSNDDLEEMLKELKQKYEELKGGN